MNREINRIIAHAGKFHADDLFATSLLLMLFPHAVVIRTRDPELLTEGVNDPGTAMVDVGGFFDPKLNNFDHHQRSFTEARGPAKLPGHSDAISIPYSSAGLIWKYFHAEFLEIFLLDQDVTKEEIAAIHQRFDDEFVRYVDAGDNGISFMNSSLDIQSFSGMINSFNIHSGDFYDEDQLNTFLGLTAFVKTFIYHRCKILLGKIRNDQKLSQLVERAVLENRQYVVFDTSLGSKVIPDVVQIRRFDTQNVIKYAVFNHEDNTNDWTIKCIPESAESPMSKTLELPEVFRGLTGEELSQKSNIPDMVFCHKGLFMAKAASKESAIAFTELSLATVRK